MSYSSNALVAIETARNPPAPLPATSAAPSGEKSAELSAALAQHARELTPKQKLCAELYVLCGSKVQAYREAYDVQERGSAWDYTAACRTLDLPHVLDYIYKLESVSARNIVLDVQELLAADLAIVRAARHAPTITWHEWRNCRHCYGIEHKY